jgi:formate-dependent phosphoribosylglycinamide formyltransferase (GAR transformylase)
MSNELIDFGHLNLLILGSRKGLISALTKLGIPHRVIKDVNSISVEPGEKFTHVLASGEGTVALANQVRKDLNLTPIPERVVTLCSDKLEMKQEATRKGIPVTAFLPGATELSSKEIYDILGPKVIVKEKNNSGGRGQKVYHSPEPISSTENDLIEGFISGREMSVESFIENGEISYASTTKYLEIGVINIVPSLENQEILKKVLELNQKVIKAFGILFGLTHLEVYITEDGILFGEIALRPPGGHIMTLMNEAHGIDSWKAYILLHIGHKLPEMESLGRQAGAIVYHPGVGTIESIEGEKQLLKLETLKIAKIRGKLGEKVSSRKGVGQERAHFIFSSENRDLLEKEIKETRATFKMHLN